jgi:hypothetical protein
MTGHGTSAAVQMHNALGEKLCEQCVGYMTRLYGEGFRSSLVDDGTVEITVRYPRTAYWKLVSMAEDQGMDPADLLVKQSLMEVDPQSRKMHRLTIGQERHIRALWRDGKSTTAISKEVGVQRKVVLDRLESWGLSPNKPKPATGRERMR